MKRISLLLRRLVLGLSILFSLGSLAQSSDFKVQHLQDDVGNSGTSNNSFTAVSSLDKAFVLANNNRKVNGGRVGNGGTLNGDDVSGARVLSDLGSLTYFRESASINANMRFNSSIWEYTGPDGGENEFIVRARYKLTLDGSSNSVAQSLTDISNADNCIPFITGILNNDGSQGADSGTAIAYLENASTLRVQKGTNGNNITVFVTVVEFTGSNWTVLHGDSGNVSGDTGSIALTRSSDGSGSTSDVNSWNEAIIFAHHRGDNNVNGLNRAIADNWPIMEPGSNTQTVDWRFNSNHDSNGTNRQFVHVLVNPNINVTRFQSSSNAANESTINISSAGLTSIDEALIIGSSITSGGGTAYARGWRNYYLKTPTQAAHWSHRSGNSMSHEIQIVDLSALSSGPQTSYCNSWGHLSWDTGVTNVTFNTINNSDASPKDNGYEDFTSSHSTTVFRNSTRNLSVSVDTDGNYIAHAYAWIDWNQDFDFDDPGEAYDLGTALNVTSGQTNLSPLAITVPSDAVLGATRMRVSAQFVNPPSSCDTNFDGEVEDYEIVVGEATPEAEINITGNNFVIASGDSTPSLLDNTDFGDVAFESGSTSHTFIIENLGSGNVLNLTGTNPYVIIGGAHASDFSLTTVPSNNIGAEESTSFAISFDPSASGLRTATVTIANSDGNENPYTFSIQGTGIIPSYCDSSGNLDYQTSVTNVTFNTINNSDGAPKDVGYEDFTATHSTTVERSSTYNLSVNVDTDGNYIVHAFAWIDWNQDYDFDDAGETYDLGSALNVEDGPTDLVPLAITVPADAAIGATRMRVSAKYWSDPSSCETDFDGEVEDYEVVVATPPLAEINITGNGNDINNGDTTTSLLNATDFGLINVNETLSKTFTIENTGPVDLEISDLTLSNNSDFSIVGTPYNTPVNPDGTTTFEVAISSGTTGEKTATVTITSNDADDPIFEFLIKATVVQNFFDSDGDGVTDNIDIDDDNDGIPDAVEELNCNNSDISLTSNYKFLNESFGTGERTTINTTYNAETTYCFEDGTSSCPDLGGIDLNDGEYTVYYKAGDGDGTNDTPNEEVGSWADTHWYLGEDHTPNDTNGRMAMFNASYDAGVFYTASITGALPNIPISYSFWVINLDRTDAPGIETRLRPDILVEFKDLEGNLLASIATGDIPPTTAGNLEGDWYNFSADLTLNVSEFNVFFYNNETGGAGNDLALDDIQITQSLCDTDGDTVADVFDLDSDNDGIPDVVEAGFDSVSNGTALIASWTDNNNNGMHDPFEGATILDSDGDGTPNYLDLDSDNDALFDVDESGAGNSADPNFINGDGDIDGDGVGDGEDTDAVREKDYNSDGTTELFPDGILDVYDFKSGSTMSTAYGNENQGTTHAYFVKDSDNDGLPDYIDIYNNTSETFDIATSLYAELDANNDGVIDDTLDSEGDGLLDLFDTDDDAFGSPRDLNTELQIRFDGRNDYIQDSSIIDDWGEITLMGWVRIDDSGTGDKFLFGQNNFNLKILSSGYLQANISGTTVTYSTAITPNRWTHIGVSYSVSNEEYKLYVNGETVRQGDKSGLLNSDSSLLTIAKNPSSTTEYFKGYIDEIRLFNKALSDDEIQKMIYQEIENNGNVRGTVVPLDIENLSWSNLVKYYRLNGFKGSITDDLTTPEIDEGTGAKLFNIKDITQQSAPMPFVSSQGGVSLPDALDNSSNGILGLDAITYDWSIVRIAHNDVTYDDTQKHLGLIINEMDSGANPIEYHVRNDSELNVSWFLKLDGFIDLEGESQLIQGQNSFLDPTSKGKIERDQQGTADTFTYNYWSSPVGSINATTNNNDYQLVNVLKDGSNPDNPLDINWLTTSYNGTNTTPIGLADYWIWKFDNHMSNDYSSWQHVRSTGTLSPGEGFTMKGPGSGPIAAEQNYVFEGKPNNGEITLPLNAENNYLLGNPYPSAIDANQFIIDNGGILGYEGSEDSTPTISGTLYFWEHWGGGSHNLADYQGGYAIYNFSGAVAAPSYGTNDPDVATGGSPTKLPGRYIPVSQGFFVLGENDGNVVFRNSQRVFAKESNSNSVFMRNAAASESSNDDNEGLEDPRMKFRIGFNSSGTIHRQLLVTIDSLATPGFDRGFDANLYDALVDDMYWMIEGNKYTIQGYNEVLDETIFPLGLHTDQNGSNEITIDALENIPEDLNIYLHDKALDVYQDLRASSYQFNLDAGEYLDRFEITFSNQEALSTEEVFQDGFNIYYAMGRSKIVILNPNGLDLKKLEVFDINGKVVFDKEPWPGSYNEYALQKLSTGVYIIRLQTDNGLKTKKIIVK